MERRELGPLDVVESNRVALAETVNDAVDVMARDARVVHDLTDPEVVCKICDAGVNDVETCRATQEDA